MSRSRSCRTRRRERQTAIVQYTKARESLQLAGFLETLPVGAVRDERVDPATQAEQALPALSRRAVRQGWAVPDAKKPELVDELIRVVADPVSTPTEKVASVRTLLAADRLQWERDREDLANKVNGGRQTKVVVTAHDALAFFREIERQAGTPIMCESMRQIEDDVSRVMPEAIIPPT